MIDTWESREASVATRPSTCPLASMTCHRLSALFALATNVRMKRESFVGPTETNPVTGSHAIAYTFACNRKPQ